MTASTGTITVEVLVKDEDATKVNFEVIRQEVHDFIKGRYARLSPGTVLEGLELMCHGSSIITVEVIDYYGSEPEDLSHSVEEVEITTSVYAFTISPGLRQRRVIPGSADKGDAQYSGLQITDLPSRSLHQSWRSLTYNKSMPSRLLNYITRAIAFTTNNSTYRSEHFYSSRLLLLHGPPGSGKTTLCRALAQKATIRMSQEYSGGRLVEIDANGLLSKFFGESGKQVSKAFEAVRTMASDPRLLVFVLLDEVESIAGKRESVTNGGDCNDSLRATNQLLTAIDSLRYQNNVVFLCTSNLIDSIDSAFMSRVDVKEYVPNPGTAERYAIIRSCLLELQRCGKIKPGDTSERSSQVQPDDDVQRGDLHADDIEQTKDTPQLAGPNSDDEEDNTGLEQDDTTDEVNATNELGTTDGIDTSASLGDCICGHVYIPTYGETLFSKHRSDKLANKLEELCRASDDMSGRELRRLPALAVSMYLHGQQHSLHEVLTVMQKVMQETGRKGACNGA